MGDLPAWWSGLPEYNHDEDRRAAHRIIGLICAQYLIPIAPAGGFGDLSDKSPEALTLSDTLYLWLEGALTHDMPEVQQDEVYMRRLALCLACDSPATGHTELDGLLALAEVIFLHLLNVEDYPQRPGRFSRRRW